MNQPYKHLYSLRRGYKSISANGNVNGDVVLYIEHKSDTSGQTGVLMALPRDDAKRFAKAVAMWAKQENEK